MQSKSLLIAIAAFALTATGVQAYGTPNMLNRAKLTEEQVQAFEEARELRQAGDFTAARDKLVKAGITEEHLQSVHRVANEARDAVRESVENKDYQAFKEAAADLPISDIITSEADFEQFCEAHELRQTGNWEQADEIMDDLGVEQGAGSAHAKRSPYISEFTPQQRAALAVARQANDRATIQAIFDEAGADPRSHRMRAW